MKTYLLVAFALVAAAVDVRGAQLAIDYRRFQIYVAPYYNSEGPSVSVGRFSAGLAAANDREFLATIAKMKQEWNALTFPELYVAAIRLYDHGYLQESVYWFYSAQYRGRQFGMLLDEPKMGSMTLSVTLGLAPNQAATASRQPMPLKRSITLSKANAVFERRNRRGEGRAPPSAVTAAVPGRLRRVNPTLIPVLVFGTPLPASD